MATDRPRLRVYLDEDTVDRWHDFCRVQGVTMSAFVEALGRALQPTERQPAWVRTVVTEARQVMAERNDRRATD